MISTERTTTSRFARPLVLIGVIASLCFSVGEGLQLRPFPVSALAQARATNTQLNVTSSYEISLRKYGPLDVPTRVQNRGKRQLVDYANPPSQSIRELTAQQILLPDPGEPVGIVSPLFGSHLSGRAPPSDS